MSFVLDASITLAWVFEDERDETVEALFDRVSETGAHAPGLWPLEVLNALAMAERRKRIDSDRRLRLAALLRELPVAIDAETTTHAWATTAQLASRWRLTIYDSAYLELALRLNLPLATRDAALHAAASAAGLSTV